MKTISTFLLAALMLACSVARSQDTFNSATDSTGLPGDHFSLQGALEMFKTSKSLEEFEQKLNTESNYVNNLDLNGDGDIDYITVSDKMKGTSHAIILSIAISETESQDIAVIEVEKSGNEEAILQIIGDETLYGDSTIVEPFEVSVDKGGKGGAGGPSPIIVKQNHMFVNVWFWPCIMFMYAPVYDPWYSPYYYHHYPYWYSPWHPMPWYMHHNHCHHYHSYYHPVYVYKLSNAHGVYGPYHKTSQTVVNKYKPAHLAYKANKAGKPIGSVKSPPVKNQVKPTTIDQGKGNTNNQVKPTTIDQGKGNPNNQGKPSTNDQGKGNTNNQVKPTTIDQGKGNSSNPVKPGTNHQGKGNSDNQIKGNQNSNPNQNKGNTYTPSKESPSKGGQPVKGNSYQGKGKSGNQSKGSVSPKSSRPSSPKSSGSSRGGSSGGKRGGR